MCRGVAPLDAANADRLAGEVDLIQLQIDKLGCPQAVTKCDQDGRCIPMAVSVGLPCYRHQLVDLGLGQVVTLADVLTVSEGSAPGINIS